MIRKLAIISIAILLLTAPVMAKEITEKVNDKTIIAYQSGEGYLIHTEHFGDIHVMEKEYQQVFIGDNITFDTQSNFGLYSILKINGADLNG